MSLKFGLSLKNKAPNALSKPNAKPAPKKKKPLLDDEDEDPKAKTAAPNDAQEIGEFNFDDTLSSLPSPPKPTSTKLKKGQPPAPPTRKPTSKHDDPTHLSASASAKESALRAAEALATDSTIYDYDSAYDALHAASALKKASEASDPSARAPKYMDSLFSAAEQRKSDQLRARDKFLQRTRENEGDEFADKEKFVTSAYAAHQEESARAEEEEKKRVAREEEEQRKFGMVGFHKKMLAEREKRHQEAMAAAEKIKQEGIVVPVAGEDEGKKTEQQIVQELEAQGKKVLLNEDGQVADKRSLLSAGLNIVSKPKPPPSTTTPSTSTNPSKPPQAIFNKGSRHGVRERQTAMIAQQIEAAAKRKADEEADEAAKLAHAAKSRKTEGEVMNARERYLARKRAKEEEQGKKGG